MANPLEGFEFGSTYGAYQEPDITKKQAQAEYKKKEEEAKAKAKSKTKPAKPTSTSQSAKPKAKPKRNQQTWNPAKAVSDAVVRPISNAMAEGDKILDAFYAKADKALGRPAGWREKEKQKATAINKAVQKEGEPIKEMARIALKSTGPGIVENVIDTGVLFTDTLQQPIRALTGTYDPTKDPFNDRYIRAQTDFGITPKTVAGQKISRLLQFFNATRAATRFTTAGITKVTGTPKTLSQALKVPKGKGAQTLVDNIPGAIADFFIASPEDPETLSNFAQDLVPEFLKGLFILAADGEYDNPYQIKLKGSLDGLGLGVVSDVIGSLFKGRFFAKKAVAEGKSAEEAIADGAKIMTDEADVLAKKTEVDYKKEGEQWNDVRELQLNKLLDEENALRQQREQINPDDVDGIKEIDQKLERNRIDQEEVDLAIVDNGYKEPWATEAAFKEVSIPESIVYGRNWLTDAAVKRLNLEDSWKDIIQPAIKNLDPEVLNQIYRNQGKAAWEKIKGDHLKTLVEKFTEVMDTAQTADEAKDLAMTYLRKSGQTFTKASGEMIEDEAVIVLQATMQGMAEELTKAARSFADVDSSLLANGNQVDRMLDRLVGLMMLRKEGWSLDAGRRLLLGKQPSFKRMIEETAEDMSENVLTPRMLRNWAADIKARFREGDPSAVEELRMMSLAMQLAGGDPSKAIAFGETVIRSLGQSALGLFYNSILSGPKTIVRNMGSIIRVFAQPLFVGIVGAVEGDDRLIGAAGAGMIGAMSGISDAFHVAATTLKSGVPASYNQLSVIRKTERMAMVDAIADAASSPAEKTAAGAIKALYALENWTEIGPRLLMSTDDFVRTVAIRQKIYEDAMIKAFDAKVQGKGSLKDLQEAAIREMEKKINFKTGQFTDKTLREYAENITYQDDPGGFVNSLANTIEQAAPLGIPVGRYAFPFVRTPANIMRFQLQMTPGVTTPLLQNFIQGYKKAIADGDQLKIAEYQGREAVGSFLVSFGYTHAWAGVITGNPPMDKDERELWRQAQIQPRSIKVGDSWVSYNWFEPLSNWIAAAADLGHLERNGQIEDGTAVGTRLAFAIAASFTEKTYLSGLDGLSLFSNPYDTVADFLKAKERFGEPTGPADRARASLIGFVDSHLPGAGIRRAWNRSSDPYYREYESWTQKALYDMMPWMSKQNIPFSISILTGKPILNPGGGRRNATIPFEMTKVNTDPVAKELVAMNVWPTIDYKQTSDGLKLDSQARVRLQELMYGEGELPATLKKWFNSTEFKQDKLNFKNKTADRGEMYIEPIYIRKTKEILSNAHQRATQALLAERPDLEEKIRKVGQLKFSQSQGNYASQPELETQTKDKQLQQLKRLADFGT